MQIKFGVDKSLLWRIGPIQKVSALRSRVGWTSARKERDPPRSLAIYVRDCVSDDDGGGFIRLMYMATTC